MIKDNSKDLQKNPESDLLYTFIKNNDSICTWKTMGKNLDNREFSENILKITGYSSKELLNHPGGYTSLIVSDDYIRIQPLYKNMPEMSVEENYSLIYRINSRDHNIVWVKEELQVQKNNIGEIEGYYGFIQNISEFKKLESLLITENENLNQLNKSKDKFISILSHDLRAPFTSILGFSEILMNEPELTQNEKNEYLNYIHESSQNQLQLINYLLDWSRLQTGRMKIEIDRINALSTVFNCIASLTGNAIRKNIDIKTDIPDNIFIKADEKLINLAITNLLSNAIKYSYEHKNVEISAGVFNDNKIEFVIKDSGIGIPEQLREKLFKVEKKFSTTGTKGEKGTGLGLSLVKEIIDKHMGDIWFYSEVDKGSEFHFTVPSSQNIILIVDDEIEEKDYLEKVISENYPEYNLIISENGFEALNLISKEIPSLIVAKHDIPLMDGIQLLKSVRKGEKGFKVPYIAIVNDISQEINKKYHEFSATSFLQKPFSAKKLKEILNSALN
jgi:PAS domain S-box-containing protein